MNSYYANLLMDIAPGLTIVSVALLAALPPHLLMYPSRRGRARSAIAYLLGFFAGVAATILIAGTIGARVPDNTAIIAPGMLAAFFAPFGGMLRARLRRPPRRQARGHAFERGLSR
jgi:hypothetical protein